VVLVLNYLQLSPGILAAILARIAVRLQLALIIVFI